MQLREVSLIQSVYTKDKSGLCNLQENITIFLFQISILELYFINF